MSRDMLLTTVCLAVIALPEAIRGTTGLVIPPIGSFLITFGAVVAGIILKQLPPWGGVEAPHG